MALSQERLGELLIIGQALIWGIFPVITKITYASFSPFFTAGISALFGAVFLFIVSFFRGNFSEWGRKESYKPILINTLCIGIFYHALFFFGLQYTSASNAAIVVQAEIFFTILTLRFWNKEKLSQWQITGSILMVLGILAIFFQNGFSPKNGDLILLFACMIPPLGNYYVKEARKYVSSVTILLIRNLISGIIFLFIAFTFFAVPSFTDLNVFFLFLVINGVLIFGLSKLMWVEGIYRILIGKAISLSAITPAFTLLYAFLFLREIPTGWQIAGLIGVMLGVYLLMKNHESKGK